MFGRCGSLLFGVLNIWFGGVLGMLEVVILLLVDI